MSKMQAFAIAAAALIFTAVGGWAASTIGARTATFTQTGAQFDTLRAMSNAKDLPVSAHDLVLT